MKVTAILWVRNKKDTQQKEKTIMVRYWDQLGNKYKYFSTGYKITPSYFVNGRVSSKHPDHETINKRIQEIIEEILKPEVKPLDSKAENDANEQMVGDSPSFLSFFKNYNGSFTIDQVSMRKRHKTILDKFTEYLLSKGKSDISFKEIDSELITDYFSNYLTYSKGKDNLKLAPSSLHGYYKKFRTVFNKGCEHFKLALPNPFTNPPAMGKSNSRFLNQSQINKFLVMPSKEIRQPTHLLIHSSNKLFQTRCCFLFQYYGFGMRVSDFLLLRWSNIVGREIIYTMRKTDKVMNIRIYNNLADIMKFFLPFEFKLYYLKTIYDEKLLAYLTESEYSVYIQKGGTPISSDSEDQLIYNGHKITIESPEYLLVLSKVFRSISSDPTFKHYPISPYISINLLSSVTNIAEEYDLTGRKTALYNKDLKELQKHLKLTINFGLTTHCARHSWANFLLDKDTEVAFIKEFLGHSDIAITSKYLKSIGKELYSEKINELFGLKDVSDESIESHNE